MTKKPTPPKKPRLSIIRGGKVSPSAHSVEGVLQAALENHHQRPYSDLFVVGVRYNGQAHVIDADIMHHSRDRVRLLGILHWAVDRFLARYLSPR